jgi:hypothetical protein
LKEKIKREPPVAEAAPPLLGKEGSLIRENGSKKLPSLQRRGVSRFRLTGWFSLSIQNIP